MWGGTRCGASQGRTGMAEEWQMAAVSRSEFYMALDFIWAFLMILALNQFIEGAALLKYLAFAVALGMNLYMTARTFQSRAGNKGGT